MIDQKLLTPRSTVNKNIRSRIRQVINAVAIIRSLKYVQIKNVKKNLGLHVEIKIANVNSSMDSA